MFTITNIDKKIKAFDDLIEEENENIMQYYALGETGDIADEATQSSRRFENC